MINTKLYKNFHLDEPERQQKYLAENNIIVPHDPKVKRTTQRMNWVLQWLSNTSYKGECAWEVETVDMFVEAFPEAKKSLKYYMMGANSCPMLNQAAGKAHKLGYLDAGSVGNQDARSYNQRTWCRYWKLTPAGEHYLEEQDG